MMRRRTFLSTMAAAPAVLTRTSQAAERQPVYFLMYSRYGDFLTPKFAMERVERSLAALTKLRTEHPELKPSLLVQMSGMMAEQFQNMNQSTKVVDTLKRNADSGLLQLGYHGADEPTYHNRPHPDFSEVEAAEDRWKAYSLAAESFLSAFKDPLRGNPNPAASGGLLRMQEVFGPAAAISKYNEFTGGDAPIVNQIKRWNSTAPVWGVEVSDPFRGIHGYGGSVLMAGKQASVAPNMFPEIFWESGRLRVSEVSLGDIKPLVSSDGPDPLKAMLGKLKRERPRILMVDFGGYTRYFKTRPDGSYLFPTALQYAWDYPHAPQMPTTLNTFESPRGVEAAYQREAAFMKYLLTEFFPQNPGSRFISPNEIRDMTEIDANLPSSVVRSAIQSLHESFNKLRTYPPVTVSVDGRYFSLAEMFGLLTEALAIRKQGGELPASMPLKNVYGPSRLELGMGANQGSIEVSAIVAKAAELAPAVNDDSYQMVPKNLVPSRVSVGGTELMPVQFLRMMADAFVNPEPGRKIPVQMCNARSEWGEAYPHNVPLYDIGSVWTLKPASVKPLA